jgi:hypothetical protein
MNVALNFMPVKPRPPAERLHHWLRWEIESQLERFEFRLIANRIQKWINFQFHHPG